MKILTPQRLASIKTSCCKVPYQGARCSKCWEDYAQDLIKLDAFLLSELYAVCPPGYVRDESGWLHSEKAWSRSRGVMKSVKIVTTTLITTKKCLLCKQEKPLNHFMRGNGFMGRHAHCLLCSEELKNKRYESKRHAL